MATTTHTATRQQLDELDELLRQMLDGPAGSGEAPPAPPVFPSGRVAEVAPAPAPAPPPRPSKKVAAVLDMPSPPLADEPATAVAWNIDLNPRSGSSVLGARSPLAEKIASGQFGDLAPDESPLVPSLHVVAPPPVDEKSLTAASSVDRPLWVGPAERINQIFDRWADTWGLPGRLIRSGPGRTALGYAGIAMLVYATYLFASNWSGWSTPVSGLK